MELLNRYSKNSYQGSRIHKAAEMVRKLPDAEDRPVPQLPPEIRLDRRLSDETVSALVQAYKDGTSTTQLRGQFNLSQGSVVRILHRHGVAMRGQGLSSSDVQTAVQLYQGGDTLAQLAERFNVSPNAVRRGDCPGLASICMAFSMKMADSLGFVLTSCLANRRKPAFLRVRRGSTYRLNSGVRG